MKWSRLLQRWRHESDAGPIVEFAIVAPVLFLVIFFVVDISRALMMRSHLVTVARESARYASVLEFPCASANQTYIKARADTMLTKLGATAPTAAQFKIGTSTDTTCTTSPAITNISVLIRSYPYRLLTPLVPTLNLTVRATFRWERSAP